MRKTQWRLSYIYIETHLLKKHGQTLKNYYNFKDHQNL